MILLDEATANLSSGDMMDGETAFKLYDTYGFPLDLTQDALRAKGISVNLDGFEDAMAKQKAMARDAWTGSGDKAGGAEWLKLKERFGATSFEGYDRSETTGKVLAIVKGRRRGGGRRGGRHRAGVVRPHAFLRRERRAGVGRLRHGGVGWRCG